MSKFYIEIHTIHTATYEVEADDEPSAWEAYNHGQATLIDAIDSTDADCWEA